MHRLLLPMGLIVEQKFDSQNKVGRLKIPALFIHGTKDAPCLIGPKCDPHIIKIFARRQRKADFRPLDANTVSVKKPIRHNLGQKIIMLGEENFVS